MALSAHSLASGSSGNSILVRDGDTALLIDAGMGIRRLTAAMAEFEMNAADLSAILITHEHSDHITGAVRMARRYNVPLISTAPTLAAIPEAESVPHRVIDAGGEMAFGNVLVRSFAISHDAVCPVGYSVNSNSAKVCSVTDTGMLTPELIREAESADLLILESNHDVDMLRTGPYPYYLKRRISGDRGHLSNDTAAGLLVELAAKEREMSVWLAHLSQTNNTPSIALTTAQYMLYTCLGTPMDVQVALRDVPSLTWRQKEGPYQMSLFDRN